MSDRDPVDGTVHPVNNTDGKLQQLLLFYREGCSGDVVVFPLCYSEFELQGEKNEKQMYSIGWLSVERTASESPDLFQEMFLDDRNTQ